MPFNSFIFLLFLPVVFIIHYFSPGRFRWMVLLVASFIFYATLDAPHLIAVLLFITTITFFTGIWIDKGKDTRTKKFVLLFGVSTNILALIILKYQAFITNSLNLLLKRIAPLATISTSEVVIIIGVSYFIFQAISYLVDIYLEIEKPERHFGHFALYMSFFPKLLQGPIERGCDLLPQFKEKYVFDYYAVRSGMLLFVWGMLKKVVIADRIGKFVSTIYGDVHSYSGVMLLFATYLYAFQIYYDFAGYTDMAKGTARMFGIKLSENFNNPYLATSIADFWRRWHISFSRWILDYIFRPLQMKWRNYGQIGIALALIITFIVSGVWHGASLGFVIWGAIHGLYLSFSVFYRPYQKKIYRLFGIEKAKWLKLWQVFVTFNLVCFSWIFFRSENLADALYVIRNIFRFNVLTSILTSEVWFETANKISTGRYWLDIAIIAITSVLILLVHLFKHNNDIGHCNMYMRWLVYVSLVLIVVFGGYYGGDSFVYFKF